MLVKDYFLENDGMLDLYTNAITKAHGEHHPEVFEVRKVYQAIEEKAKKDNWDFTPEEEKLRALTQNYEVPSDACQTMTKTYHMLQKMDELSHS